MTSAERPDDPGTGASSADARLHRRSAAARMGGSFLEAVRQSRLPGWIALIGVAAALAVIGYWMLFSHFALWDDEGYVLISARDYLAQGGLYESVYSQYGPAFFCAIDALARLGFVADHTCARLFTLGCWLGAAASCAAIVGRQTASIALGIFTLSGTFMYLYFLPDEPFHPGGMIVLILAASAFATTELLRKQQLGQAMIVLGATAAVLGLTKVNVGAFYVAGAGSWMVLQAASPNRRSVSRWLVPLALVFCTVCLMRALLHETWVQIYVLLFAIGAVTLIKVANESDAIRPRHFAIVSAIGLLTALAIAGWVYSRGTSVAALWEGVIVGPSRHAGSYSYPVDWRPGTLGSALFSLVLAFALPWIRRRFSTHAADVVIVSLRLVQAAALVTGLLLILHARVIGAVFSFIAPLIWTWVVPLSRSPLATTDAMARSFLAFVLLTQFLHGYPVGGSQESWGTFLIVPLVALGLWDLQRWMEASGSPATRTTPVWARAATALALVLLGKTALVARATHKTHAARADLRLPGAGVLRLDDSLRTAYRILAQNTVAHADILFSMPGMFSFNLWTDVPTPTTKNTTLWFALLKDGEQREIIAALERSPRACVIMQEPLLTLLRAGNIAAKGPLNDYIGERFSPAFRVEGFTFLVRRGRLIAPLGMARVARPESPEGRRANLRVDICLIGDDVPITSIEVLDPTQPNVPALTLDGTTTDVTTTAIDGGGRPVASPVTRAWPIRIKGPGRVSFELPERPVPWTPAATFRFKGTSGEVIAEARLHE